MDDCPLRSTSPSKCLHGAQPTQQKLKCLHGAQLGGWVRATSVKKRDPARGKRCGGVAVIRNQKSDCYWNDDTGHQWF
eukprot:COSAG02_NODE_1538_length_12042_cov_323.842083_2_plen_78_part_00